MAIELATAYVSLSTSAKGLRKEIDRELGAVGVEAGRKAGGGFGASLAKWGKRGAILAGGAVAAGLGTALTKGLGRLTAIENAQAKMRGLGHDTKTVDAIMKNALASVKGTSFGLGEAATTAAGAVAAGIKPGKELEGVLKSVANSAAASGSSMEEMGAIYNKAASLGKAQNDILQQVADRGIPIYQALAEQMGVTSEEIFKMASEGKVSFEDFEKAMTSASGTVAEEMGKTFTGSLKNAWAAVGRIGANLLSGVFDKFGPTVQKVTEWLGSLEPVATRVGEAIGAFVDKVSTGIQSLVDLLVKGDFTAAFRETFGVEEDHPFVGFLFAVRENAAAAFDYIRNTAIPAVQGFLQGLRDGEGPGGKFRDILTAVGDAAKSVFGWLRDEGLPALQALGGFVMERLWPDLKAAFLDYIIPAMREVGRVIKNFWEGDAQPALRGLWEFIKNILAPFLVDFYENGIKPTFRLIGDAIAGAWNNVIKPTFAALKDGGTQVKDRFNTVKDGIKTAWDRVSSIVSGGWDKIKVVLDKFKSGLDSLKSKFSSVKDGIARVWGTIGAAIAGPINKVIDIVNGFLEKLRKGINDIPGVEFNEPWGVIKHVPVPSGGAGGSAGAARPVQMLADGGSVLGRSPHSRADNVPIWATAGEFMLPVRAVKRLLSEYGPQGLELLRQGRLPMFGGGDAGGGPRRWLGKMGDWASAVWDGGKRIVQQLFDELLGGIGSSWPAQAAKGAISGTAQGVVQWVKDKVFGGTAPGSFGAPVGAGIRWPYGWRTMPKWGFPDFHTGVDYAIPTGTQVRAAASGRASIGWDGPGGRYVDIAHPGGLHSGYFHLSKALVQAGQMVTKGALIALSGNTGTATTGPHLHFQVGRGSVWNHTNPAPFLSRGLGAPVGGGGAAGIKPLLFDSGGYLPTGTSLVRNNTGKPEPLIRGDQPMRIEGRLRLDGDGFGTLIDARIQADHDHARYDSRMVGAR